MRRDGKLSCISHSRYIYDKGLPKLQNFIFQQPKNLTVALEHCITAVVEVNPLLQNLENWFIVLLLLYPSCHVLAYNSLQLADTQLACLHQLWAQALHPRGHSAQLLALYVTHPLPLHRRRI